MSPTWSPITASLLDGIFAGGVRSCSAPAASSGQVSLDFTPDPRKTFNRGDSTYFLNGRGGEISSPFTPKSLGEPLGRIARLGKDFFTLEHSIDLHPGDGLCFLKRAGNKSWPVWPYSALKGNKIYPARMDGLAKGMELHRNHDQAFLRHAGKKSPAAQDLLCDCD